MKKKLIFLILATFTFLIFQIIKFLPDGKVHVIFCNVGQGDGAYIRSPNGEDIVIDGGPDERVLACLGKHMPFWDRSIELMVLSHPHADHLTGLIEILKRYQVKKILDSSASEITGEYKLWEDLIKEKRVLRQEAREGQNIIVDKLRFIILWPKEIKELAGAKNLHNLLSTVLKINYGQFSVFFTGDIDGEAEGRILDLGYDLSSTILKVSHHGSRFSSTQTFLEEVKPKLAVISVGKNSYGHPSPEILQRLDSLGISFLRTDRDGSVEIISDGNRWRIVKDKSPKSPK